MTNAAPIQVVTYNILANSYLNLEWYRHCDREALNWEKRKALLCQQVKNFDAQIICLQEVEQDAFDQLEQELASRGYQGIYAKKGNDKPDGCATFIKTAAVQLKKSAVIYYQDKAKGTLHSGHLALVVYLEVAGGSIGIINTHLKWDRKDRAKARHIGYQQLQELLAKVEADRATSAWVICGDFNAQPDSAIIKEIRQRGWHDAYYGQEQNSCNPNGKAKRLDYIFHSHNLTALPTKLKRIFNRTPLPSLTEPSDHLALAATLARQ
jgi:protein angel